MERFEVLGDAFLKYVVGRYNFIIYEGLDEGQLTRRRSAVVNNSNLYELSIRRNLQVHLEHNICLTSMLCDLQFYKNHYVLHYLSLA